MKGLTLFASILFAKPYVKMFSYRVGVRPAAACGLYSWPCGVLLAWPLETWKKKRERERERERERLVPVVMVIRGEEEEPCCGSLGGISPVSCRRCRIESSSILASC